MFPPNIANRILTIDTETTGLDKINDRPFLVQIQVDDEPPVLSRDMGGAVAFLNDAMPLAKLNVFHNAKFDLHQLTNVGLDPDRVHNSHLFDTQVVEALIDEHRGDYHLDSLAKSYLGIGKTGEEELYGWLAEKFGGKPTRKAQIGRISLAPDDLVDKYAAGDNAATYGIYKKQRDIIQQRNLHQIVNLEMDTLFALYEIERRGVPVDITRVQVVRNDFNRQLDTIAAQTLSMCGFPVNVRSMPQMIAAFETLGLKPPVGANGRTSFAAEVLEDVDHPLVDLVKSARAYRMMVSTFLNGFENNIYPDGRIRSDFNQTRNNEYGVKTGRLSSSGPNLQQIPNPKRKNRTIAERVRSLFRAPEGFMWVSSDWEQFEFRIFGHYTKDENLISAFINDPTLDYHQVVADLTGLARNPFAKQLNLGLVFGMGEGKMAQKIGLPYQTRQGKLFAGKEAKKIFTQYHTKLPRVKKLLRAAEARARSRGYVVTALGRHLHFPGGKGAHKAGGLLFQGTAADLMKAKLVQLNEEFRKTSVELILPVHDEFNLLTPGEMAEDVRGSVQAIMESVPEITIPILADAGIGETWCDASK